MKSSIENWKVTKNRRGENVKRECDTPNPLHIKHLPTPFAEKFNHMPHVFFWYFHSGNLQAIHI